MTFWKHNKKKNITGQKLFVVELQFFATFKFQACTLTHTKITNFKQLLFSHFSQEKKSTFFEKRPHTLTDLMSELRCAECGESGSLYVCVLEGKQMGYSTKLSLKCKHCEYSKEGYSSPRCNYSNEPSTPFEINRRMALFSHEIGGSHASLKKFSAVVGMPVMTLSTYQNHDKNLVGECYV